MQQDTSFGSIEYSRTAIASLVYNAALQTYGVVGMTTSTRARGVAATITKEPHRGVKIVTDQEQNLVIDLYIIIEYGTNIASVANSLINTTRYTVQNATGLKVGQVNIHVQGLRISTPGQPF